jgi:hypothetical protein
MQIVVVVLYPCRADNAPTGEKSGHAFCPSAKHAGNVTDAEPVADEEFSSCILCARSAIHGRSGGDYDSPLGEWGAAANVSGTFSRVPGLPPSRAMGGLLTRLSPGTSLLRAVLAGALPVVGLLLRLISKALLSEGHFSWIVRSSLVMLVGNAFVVHRCEGAPKQTGENLESAKCR